MVAAIGWNVGDLVTGPESVMDDIGEVIGLAFHVAAIAFLVLARKEFWAKVRRGALVKAAATLVAGMAVGILIGWGLLEMFPGSPGQRDDRFLYALNRVSRVRRRRRRRVRRPHPHVFVNALLGLFGALALMVDRDRAVPVAARRERTDRRGRVRDPRPARAVRQERLARATSPPAATSRWCSRPTAARRSPTASRSASAWPAATRVGDPKAWPQAIAAWLTLCQSYGWAPGVMGASSTGAQAFREAGLNALQLGDEAILYPDSFRLSGPDMQPVRQAVTRARRAGADRADPAPPRPRPPRRWPR